MMVADTRRLAADWDYAWHNARQAYYQFQPAPDASDTKEPGHHDLIALEKRIECEKRAREDEKLQLVALLEAYLAVRNMGFDAIQDSIVELGSQATTKEIKQIFELAVTKIDANNGQKQALLGFHAAGDFLLHWYAANVGKPT